MSLTSLPWEQTPFVLISVFWSCSVFQVINGNPIRSRSSWLSACSWCCLRFFPSMSFRIPRRPPSQKRPMPRRQRKARQAPKSTTLARTGGVLRQDESNLGNQKGTGFQGPFDVLSLDVHFDQSVFTVYTFHLTETLNRHTDIHRYCEQTRAYIHTVYIYVYMYIYYIYVYFHILYIICIYVPHINIIWICLICIEYLEIRDKLIPLPAPLITLVRWWKGWNRRSSVAPLPAAGRWKYIFSTLGMLELQTCAVYPGIFRFHYLHRCWDDGEILQPLLYPGLKMERVACEEQISILHCRWLKSCTNFGCTNTGMYNALKSKVYAFICIP